MRIAVFGASGPTGRLLVGRALAAGHTVTAVTRHPDRVVPGDGLAVAGADAADPTSVDAAVAGHDAVLSALGVARSRGPVSLYSTGTSNLIAAMGRHGLRRLVVVSSAALGPDYHARDGWLWRRVMEPLFMTGPGRTTYDDMRRMESAVRGSDLDWTILRPCWLFTSTGATGYRLEENCLRGMYTARSDLAASMVAQLAGDGPVGRTVAVVTTTGQPGLLTQIWREGIRNRSQPEHRPARR